MKKVAIIGSGSWGAALGIYLAKLGKEVKIWSFSEEEANLLNKERKCIFLPNAEIPENVSCSNSFGDVIQDSDIILHVTPSKFTRDTVKQYKDYVTDQPIVICTKGFEKDTLLTLDEVVKQELPNATIGVFSGPSHAEEVSQGIPTVMVIASEDEKLIKEFQKEFSSEYLRIYTSKDVKGVELGGSLKNIIAFCAGIANGLELGDNSLAALITRGLNEISILGVKLGGNKETFYGLSGLGDLIVTALSEHSRNNRAGRLIGQGLSIEETQKQIGMTIESIDNIEVAYTLGKKYNLELPIVEVVYNILYNKLPPEEAVKRLMTRKNIEEFKNSKK